LAIIWIFVFFFLAIIGSFLGILIGIVVLFFFVGGLNTFLTRWIWSADIRSDLLSLFIHGVGLFVALLIASLPMFFLLGTPYSLALSIALFVPYALIDGFIAKNIAFALRKHTEPVFSTNVPSEKATDQDTEIEHGTPKESSVEDEAVEAGRLYDKLREIRQSLGIPDRNANSQRRNSSEYEARRQLRRSRKKSLRKTRG
jgi:uncharacterized protein YacL